MPAEAEQNVSFQDVNYVLIPEPVGIFDVNELHIYIFFFFTENKIYNAPLYPDVIHFILNF